MPLSHRGFPLHLQSFLRSVSFYLCVSFHPLPASPSDIRGSKVPKSVKESYDALVEIFECIEGFVRRLMICTNIEHPIPAMTEVVIKIMAQLISVFALATKQMEQGKLSKSLLSRDHSMTYILQKNMRRNSWERMKLNLSSNGLIDSQQR